MSEKKTRRRLGAVIAIILVLTMSVAAMAETTQEKLDKKKKEQQETQEQLNDTKDNLSSLKGTRNALQSELNNLNIMLDESSAKLEDIEQKIKLKEDEVTQAELDLMEAQRIQQEQYEAMILRIQFMYENGDSSMLELLFSAKDFADFLNKGEYIEKIADYDRRKLEEYKDTCKMVEEQKSNFEIQLADLKSLKDEETKEQERISAQVKKTQGSVATYASQIESTQAQMLAYEAEIEKQNNDIEKLKKQIEEEKRLAALAAQSAKRDISAVTFEENDRYLLANLIYCEAGNQPYEGKVAVGAVVINRLLSSVFPNTITGVIYQKNQFSPVRSGRYALALANNYATTSCYQAADAAMAGNTTVADCLFFRTPVDYITPRYRIAGHIFY
ncbi:MAG: cell wall hydrolase [Lachnospiraceae bacterium]|nr:cell wall hydrolase [Candidatus Merdinaster equi]